MQLRRETPTTQKSGSFEVSLIPRSRSWEDAIHWYDEAVNKTQEDEGGEFDSTMEDPSYLLMARQAEMYMEGGHGLEKNPSSAGQSCYLCDPREKRANLWNVM